MVKIPDIPVILFVRVKSSVNDEAVASINLKREQLRVLRELDRE